MTEEELYRELTGLLEKGFDDSFMQFCADVFSSHEYPPENLPAARMHAFYLRQAVCLLLGWNMETGFPLMKECREVAEKSYRSALETDRLFCNIFIENWCDNYSRPAKSFKG